MCFVFIPTTWGSDPNKPWHHEPWQSKMFTDGDLMCLVIIKHRLRSNNFPCGPACLLRRTITNCAPYFEYMKISIFNLGTNLFQRFRCSRRTRTYRRNGLQNAAKTKINHIHHPIIRIVGRMPLLRSTIPMGTRC